MTITATSIEQDYQNETTSVWFDVDGESFAVSANSGIYTLLDSEGYPIEDQNDHENMKQKLTPHYEKIALEDYCGEDTQIEEVLES